MREHEGMSVVTTVLLYTGETIGDRDKRVERINAALCDLPGGRYSDGVARWELWHITRYPDGIRLWGGEKMPDELWGGAFNHFDLCDLARIVLSIPWERPGRLTVMAHVDNDMYGGFRAYGLRDLAALLEHDGT